MPRRGEEDESDDDLDDETSDADDPDDTPKRPPPRQRSPRSRAGGVPAGPPLDDLRPG